MAHVSKEKLNPGQQDELMQQMYFVLAKLTKVSAPEFLEEFFGKEEKIMLAKRLGAIVMCISGVTPYRIWNTLKISPSTAERVCDNYNQGKYRSIERMFQKNKIEYKRIVDILEIILSAGLPPRGRGRWKGVIKNLTRK